MTPENFTYWLQGYFEISKPKTLGETEIRIIKDNLGLVFSKVTPDRREFEVLNVKDGTVRYESLSEFVTPTGC